MWERWHTFCSSFIAKYKINSANNNNIFVAVGECVDGLLSRLNSVYINFQTKTQRIQISSLCYEFATWVGVALCHVIAFCDHKNLSAIN